MIILKVWITIAVIYCVFKLTQAVFESGLIWIVLVILISNFLGGIL